MQLTAFIHQKSYEHIVFKIRKDPVTTVPASVNFIALFGLPPVLYFLLTRAFANLLQQPLIFLGLILLASLYYLSVGLFYYTYFVNYYLDLLVITNDRLLHVEQEGVFSRTISEVDLYKIQDITSSVDGFFPSMFNYGDLLIQTAGAIDKFQITSVPDPEGLRHKIMDLAEEDRKFHNTNTTTTGA